MAQQERLGAGTFDIVWMDDTPDSAPANITAVKKMLQGIEVLNVPTTQYLMSGHIIQRKTDLSSFPASTTHFQTAMDPRQKVINVWTYAQEARGMGLMLRCRKYEEFAEESSQRRGG